EGRPHQGRRADRALPGVGAGGPREPRREGRPDRVRIVRLTGGEAASTAIASRSPAIEHPDEAAWLVPPPGASRGRAHEADGQRPSRAPRVIETGAVPDVV